MRMTTEKVIARRRAERWAYETHGSVMGELPQEILRNIDWAGVAVAMGMKVPSVSFPTIHDDMQRIIDYLYEDEASAYQDLEGLFQNGHLFESILRVQRWLYAERT